MAITGRYFEHQEYVKAERGFTMEDGSQKGIEVDLYEQSESICSGASSHELLVTYPRLSAYDTAYGRFNLLAYLYATNFYKNLKTKSWKKTGVLILNHDKETQKKQKALIERRRC